jgi:hypothetical protein
MYSKIKAKLHTQNYKQRTSKEIQNYERKNKLMFIQIEKPDNTKKFYPCVINKTDIIFSNDELLLLNKALKYNLDHKHKKWVRTRALQDETAINQLSAFVKEHM